MIHYVSAVPDIQSAINNAVDGDEIVVANMTVTSPIVITGKNGITVRAENKGMVIFDLSSAPDKYGISAYNCHDVVIEGFKVINARAGIVIGTSATNVMGETRNVVVRDCESNDTTHWGMAASSTPNCPTIAPHFLRVKILRVNTARAATENGHGLKLAANVNDAKGTGAIIEDSEIAFAYNHGIQSSNGWNDTTIIGCDVHDNSQKSFNSAAGVRFGTTQKGLLKNTKIYGLKQCGVFLQSMPRSITIEGCDISAQGYGIFAYEGENIFITKSKVVGGYRDLAIGFYCKSLSIKNS